MDQITAGLTRAAVWTGSGIDMWDIEIPALEAGDLLVRVDLATVCGSDLHTVSGRRSAQCPSILGHEAVGTVVAVGDAAGVLLGERVVWSVTVACGRCARCVSGFTAKCVGVRKIGHESASNEWVLSGSYAQHIVLPRGTATVTVPDSMPDAVAAPAACATATVMAAMEAAGDLVGKRVLIIGAGMLGVTAAAASAERDAASVRIVDRDALRQKLARRFGALDDDGSLVDIAIDFTGAADAVRSGFGRLDTGGRLVLAGSVSPGPAISIDPERVVRNWLTITGVHNYEPRHLAQAVAFLDATGERYPWAALVDTPVPLTDLTRVLAPTPEGILRSSVAPHQR
ncbi:zinc-binding dehydrogenase [Rhodococcus sp. 077-4]|uniref:zinc-binding dehydrogenase n=1 Tax=Rhodococcus sp. 077-4 TaxID=2789271 RepID=UPI0039F5C929